jgi:hypothetical protein
VYSGKPGHHPIQFHQSSPALSNIRNRWSAMRSWKFIRDAVIKERGAQAFRDCYTPLLPAPSPGSDTA